MKQPLRVLLVEDSLSDAGLIERALSNGGYEVTSLRVDKPKDLISALKLRTWDIVICDFRMPHLDAHEALRIFKESQIDIPFIVVSGRIGEDVAVEMMRAGAHDYLLKSNLTRLVPAVSRELAEAGNRRAALQTRTLQDLIFNITPDAMFVCDLQTKITLMNTACTGILGWTEEELLEHAWIDFVHPEDVEASREQFAEASAGRPVIGFENRMRCREETYRWISWNAVLIPEESLVFANGRDVTDKRKADAQLRMLGTCIAQLNDGILVTEANMGTQEDPGPPIVFVNDAFLALTGYEREEVLGRSPRFLHGLNTDKGELARIRDTMMKGERVTSELISYKRSGEEFHNEFSIVPVHDESGKIINLVAVQRDVTERKRMERALRESEEHYRRVAALNQKLLKEVNVRVGKNLEALLSLITMSRKRATELSSFASSIEGRVRSFSHVHHLMTIVNGKAAELQGILENLNNAAGKFSSNAIHVVFEGPSVLIDPGRIVPLAFALAEMFNNSIRHGAHCSRLGRLKVTWTVTRLPNGTRVNLHWAETGGPTIAIPIEPKLGFKLMEGFVNYDLGGKCTPMFKHKGAEYMIEFMVESSVSGGETTIGTD